MTLLEVIKKASANPETMIKPEKSYYPIILNSEESLLNLKPQSDQSSIPSSFVHPVYGFKISQIDTEIIELCHKFYGNLNRKLKNRSGFGSGEFLTIFNSFLENINGKIGFTIRADPSADGYTCKLIAMVGFFMGKEVSGLVMNACLDLEIWDVLEALIFHKIIDYSCYSKLVTDLIEKHKSDLLCACIKHFSNLKSSDLLSILKYFLSPTNNSYTSMDEVRKEWESQALLAVEKAIDKSLKRKTLLVANEASILLMLAYDGFLVNELCLHYLLASPNFDEFILTSAISKLNGAEMIGLVRYLGKWLKKYEKFPQAVPCPKALNLLGLKACDWVPGVEAIVKCLGFVLDEHFSTLVLHSEFHEEIRSMRDLANSFAMEARLCYSIENVVKNLIKNKSKVDDNLFS